MTIGRVDNRVDCFQGDITLHKLKLCSSGKSFLPQHLVHGWIVAFPPSVVNASRLFLDDDRHPIVDQALLDNPQVVFADLCDHLIDLLFQYSG